MSQLLKNFIDGKYSPEDDQAERVRTIISPHDGAEIGKVILSDESAANDAVDSAHRAFASWSQRTVKDRCQILFKCYYLLQQHADSLADMIVREHGKTKQEALAEIAKGLETLEYATSMPQIISGKIQEVSRGVQCQDSRLPLGVVVHIVPFNFPFMVPMWTIPIALATGNCVVLKPSEKVPFTMNKVAGLFKEAGVPDGVFNIVNGTAPVVMALCENPHVKAVTFVGTTRVAEIISHKCRILNKRVLALGGAKNHLVTSPDCNFTMASQDIVASFTGCAGQRCMAASVLLTLGPQPELLKQLVEKASALTPGSGSGNMGPVIDDESYQKILRYINEAEAAGVEVLLDGRKWRSNEQLSKEGNWIGPTILLHKNAQDAAMREEIFGPVLSIYACRDRDEAIAIENSNPYGNAAAIYTSEGGVAEWFTNRFSAGMIGINIGIPVPREPFSFGGINTSKFGDMDITGDGGVEFFTYRRKITSKWAPPEHRTWLN
eukprot:TRINITY_DN7_c0_g2_i1.p1 TRINITY_DN7_c0_g2~~TRINITY_DN7_c0_g2_i1.p1  ORF type:complete len:492 (+),score=110.42 TRINITY_DN7_c0_g2_i1:49-1524(+)